MNTCPKCGSPLQSSDGYDDLFQCGTIQNDGGVYPKIECYDRVIATLKARVEALEKAGDEMHYWITVKRDVRDLDCTEDWLKAKGHQ